MGREYATKPAEASYLWNGFEEIFLQLAFSLGGGCLPRFGGNRFRSDVLPYHPRDAVCTYVG